MKTLSFSGHGCQSLERNCNSAAISSLTNGHSGIHSSTSNNENGHGGPATPCTPGDPLTHYHHRNEDHYTAAFACMNRMRIHSQVRYFDTFSNNSCIYRIDTYSVKIRMIKYLIK